MYASPSFSRTLNLCLSAQQFHASWTSCTTPPSQANWWWKTNVLAAPDQILETGAHLTNNQELCCTPEHRQKTMVMSSLYLQTYRSTRRSSSSTSRFAERHIHVSISWCSIADLTITYYTTNSAEYPGLWKCAKIYLFYYWRGRDIPTPLIKTLQKNPAKKCPYRVCLRNSRTLSSVDVLTDSLTDYD